MPAAETSQKTTASNVDEASTAPSGLNLTV
jgi:hypothetical protein